MRNRWASLYKEYNDLTILDRREKLAVFLVVCAVISLSVFAVSILMLVIG
jgi:hypothetical protein